MSYRRIHLLNTFYVTEHDPKFVKLSDISIRLASGRTLTCPEQTDGIGRLCQEVGVTEHVLLVDGEAQKGEGGVVDVKHKLLLHPHRIQTVISWEGETKGQ